MKSQATKKAQKDKKPSKIASGKATPGKWDEMNRKQRREMMRQMQSGDLSLEVIHPDASGIDIGNESHYVAVPPSRDSQPVRCFGCTTAELKKMAEWLTQCGIRTVAIAYASHCTSLGRCETFSSNCSLFDNLTPRAFCGGLAPGFS
jgi:hypothetical protein